MRRLDARHRPMWHIAHTAAVALWVAPALALAQSAQPSSGPAPMQNPTSRDAGTQGGAGWLWVVAAILVVALIWWAMSSRRRASAPR